MSKFRFSVVIPIYNTEKYLNETIDSIINQSFGFEKIQLILINDGSSDNSERICLDYQDMYPNNIVYKYKENGGVSSACNYAFDYIEGEYVNFFGSDDIWTEDSFREVDTFFKQNATDIDMVSCRLINFGARNDVHPLDYKYKTSKVVNLVDEPNFIQLTSGNCFYSFKAIKEKRFDEKLKYEEDAMFNASLLLENNKYGVVKEAKYKYRRRQDGSAITQNLSENNYRYEDAVNYFLNGIFQLAKSKNDIIPKFIQYTVMYEMQWRFKEILPNTMTEEQIEKYKNKLQTLLKQIDDDVIYSQKNIDLPLKAYVLRLKHGNDFYQNVWWDNSIAIYNEQTVFNLKKACIIRTINCIDKKMVLSGTHDFKGLNLNYDFYVCDESGCTYKAKEYPFPKYDGYAFNNEIIKEGVKFQFEIPLEANKRYSLQIKLGGDRIIQIPLTFAFLTRFSKYYRNSYWKTGNLLIKQVRKEICTFEYTKARHISFELRTIKSLLKVKGKANKKEHLLYRFLYYVYGIFYHKKIWIVSDRLFKGGDNGENFFKYAISRKESENLNIYFLMQKNAEDYKRLKKIGKILDPESLKYKILFILSDKIISSHADAAVINPFGSKCYFLNDLFSFDYVYLQHGVLPGDLSSWLNSMNKNIRLFIVSCEREKQSLLEGNYGYTEREVSLAGMTRHDALGLTPVKKKIVFLPTWREKLAGKIMVEERDREYVEDFKDNYYCKFYNSLIGNERLINALRSFGYEGEFYVHPSFHKQSGDFIGNDTIKVGDGLADYESILNEAALMITDYSSVAFDFGYQRKPIIYCQFDSEIWNSNHFYEKGYFDYDIDGFGPVTSDVDTTVDAIIELLENDCMIEDKYKARADAFFKFSDHNNCERVYNAILNIGDK